MLLQPDTSDPASLGLKPRLVTRQSP